MEGIPVHIERILDSARTAPSHDNLQPWRFVLDGETVSFCIDHDRDRSQDITMAHLGIGAALECACLSAARMGATVRFLEPAAGAIVTVSFANPKRIPEPDLSRIRRVTNRRAYDGRAVDDATQLALREATPAKDGTQTHWFGRERVRALGPLFEEAEELFYTDRPLREQATAAIRFDVKDREEVSTGLPVGSLELSITERAALVGFRKPGASPASEVKKLAVRARRLMESASGVFVITAVGSEPITEVNVGRAMQRAWMVLTQRGLAAHPMTTMMSLARSKERDTIPDAQDDTPRRIDALLQSFRRAFPNIGNDARIMTLVRFGFADAPSCRSGRLPLEDSLADGESL